MTKEFRVTVEKVLKEKDLHDVLCTACEGGSNYWINDYKHVATRDENGDYVKLKIGKPLDDSLPEAKFSPITAIDLARAVNEILNKPLVAAYVREDILRNIDEVGMVDGDSADCIVQVAVFGELIFG